MHTDYHALTEALQAAVSALPELAEVPVVIGALPPAEGISLVASGGSQEPYLDGGAFVRQQIAVNAKSAGQERALTLISRALQAYPHSPDSECFRITGVSVQRAPAQIGLDSGGNYLFGGILEIRAFFPANPR